MKAINRIMADSTAKTRVCGVGSKSLTAAQQRIVERVSVILENASMRAVIFMNRGRVNKPEGSSAVSVEIGIVKPFRLLIEK